MAKSRVCSIPDCGKPVRARGWCNGHWIRWSRYGDPLAGQHPRDAALRYLNETVLRFEDKDACVFWPYSKTSDGYGRIGLNGRRHAVHRVVCERIHGKPPTRKHEAAHSCGNGHLGCVNPHHLSWKTRSGNFADKLIHGTDNRGEKNGYAKATEEQARKILALKGKHNQRRIAEMVGVTVSIVHHIHRGDSWRWLE